MITKELKKQLKTELETKLETDRLERVKENSKLLPVTIFTAKNNQICKNIKEHLDKEGIKYTEKDVDEYKEEFKYVTQIVNMNTIPILYSNREYMVNGRDFQNPQQLENMIKHFSDPSFTNPSLELKIIEHMKTHSYNIWQKINLLENKINPVINVLNKLTEELEEETDK